MISKYEKARHRMKVDAWGLRCSEGTEKVADMF